MAWVLGDATEQEIKVMRDAGYEVVELTDNQELVLFDGNWEKKGGDNEDKFVRVWVDCDVTQLLDLPQPQTLVDKELEVMVPCLVGFYHPHGYNIHRQEDGQLVEQVYEAGNNPGDSTSMIPVERGEDLETLHRFCEQTGKELAKEMGLPWAGCSEEDDPYEGEV